MSSAAGHSALDGIPSGDPDVDTVLRIASILQKTRVKKKLTLRDLEEQMGVSYAHLSRCERGLAQPGLVVLLRWCRALDLEFPKVWRQATKVK